MPAHTGITVKLNTAAFDERTTNQGWSSDAEAARELGLDRATIGRVRRGEQRPGAAFIDACMRKFGDDSYTDLFERES